MRQFEVQLPYHLNKINSIYNNIYNPKRKAGIVSKAERETPEYQQIKNDLPLIAEYVYKREDLDYKTTIVFISPDKSQRFEVKPEERTNRLTYQKGTYSKAKYEEAKETKEVKPKFGKYGELLEEEEETEEKQKMKEETNVPLNPIITKTSEPIKEPVAVVSDTGVVEQNKILKSTRIKLTPEQKRQAYLYPTSKEYLGMAYTSQAAISARKMKPDDYNMPIKQVSERVRTQLSKPSQSMASIIKIKK